MPAPQFINGKPVVWYEEKSGQTASLTPPQTAQQLCTLTTLRGLRAFVIRASQAWDAGLDPNVTWYLRVNGNKRFPYDGSTVQISAPEQDAWIVPLEVPEGTQVELVADLAGATNGRITGRLGIGYIERD